MRGRETGSAVRKSLLSLLLGQLDPAQSSVDDLEVREDAVVVRECDEIAVFEAPAVHACS